MKQFPQTLSGRRGFTIVELVVAFIIIAILAAVLVPTLVNRAQQAKIAAAQADLVHLGDAQERAGIDIGYMLRIYVLDDVSSDGDGIGSTDPDDVIESISDLAAMTGYTTPERIFINLASENYSTNNATLYAKMIAESNYNGPYLQWQRDVNGNDWPDDPWGSDYLFFTRAGVIYPPVGTSTGTIPDGSGDFQPDYAYEIDGTAEVAPADVFDRPTFLSLGPNGQPGDGSGSATDGRFGRGDDLVHQIGGVSSQTSPFQN